MRTSFKDYAELPLDACDGWLYTSEWDGIPTSLIELACQGTPIVASAVEGVTELITKETGWQVTNWNDPNAYVTALREMINSPGKRLSKSLALQNLVVLQHSIEQFDAAFAELITEGKSGDRH